MKTGEDRQNYRNEVIYGRMMAMDLQFSVFSEAIHRESVASNLTLDILGVGVGTAGAAVTAVDGSRILSALSGGLSGTSTAINKNMYFERTLPALLALMEAERENVRAEIMEGLLQPDSNYWLEQGLMDLERFFFAGSIPGAISAVTQQAGESKEEAERAIETVRNAAFVNVALQQRANEALDAIPNLPSGAAWDILQSPPSEIDEFVLTAVEARLGNKLTEADLSGDDAAAKEILRMVVVLLQNRSDEGLGAWNALISAKISGG